MIGAWYWKPEYDGHVLDGEQWSIELAHDDKRMETHLVNAYPPRGGHNPSEAFKQLLRAVGVLLGDQEFVNYWYFNQRGGRYG